MEADWKEGFFCTLPAGHEPPHRDAGESNVSTDIAGQRYTWVFEWQYES